ncbi:hypothetical protein SteCoe_937 [Stentor coeruleus]|uniref:Uncharacterized protein n=1 Tax=Stentor coeruleus TaxID=5963 RepID=A0A1R2D396_9CILI|nr:hypothetical protein SteCoe_937 [Stentor coeruleus]
MSKASQNFYTGSVTSQYGASNTKKTEDFLIEEEDSKVDKSRGKTLKRKYNSEEKIKSYFETVDQLISSRKKDQVVNEKVDEIVKDLRSQRSSGLNKYVDMYYDLFISKQELPPLISKKNKDFIDRINTLQRELRPELHMLPTLYENSGIKPGNKAKPAKVSVEPKLSSSRAKILMVKEIEAKHKLKTNRETLKKIPFTVRFI